jgi:Tfp pilus assembly protein PilF
MHDRTRDPLAWSISAGTPRHEAAAMRLVDRGRAELEAGTTDNALDLLDEAIRLDPGCVPAYIARAQASLLVGATRGARIDLDRAAAQQPRGPWLAEVVAVEGEVYETEGRNDAAIAAYRRALVIHPANRTARKALSRLLAR